MSNQTNIELPKKSCSIERLVTVQVDVAKVLNGQKTATRRNGVYAYPGEIMVLDGKEFKVDALYSQTLGEMTDEHAKQEGFQLRWKNINNPFLRYIRKCHGFRR